MAPEGTRKLRTHCGDCGGPPGRLGAQVHRADSEAHTAEALSLPLFLNSITGRVSPATAPSAAGDCRYGSGAMDLRRWKVMLIEAAPNTLVNGPIVRP